MHQYQLQRYSGINSKHRCPQCQHRQKTFKLYINTQTNEPLNPNVGMCDRLDKCGYHYTPRQYFEREGKGSLFIDHGSWRKDRSWFIDHGSWRKGNGPIAVSRNSYEPSTMNHELKKSYEPSTMNHELLKKSLSRKHQNNLLEHFTLLFGDVVTEWLAARYFIGTSKHWYGATVFWQVDLDGRVRAGKIMLYNVTNAKRVKLPFNHITWVHTVLKKRYETLAMRCGTSSDTRNLNTQISILKSDYNLTQCFFGEHLLKGNNQPVAIVESEKTAIIASVYMPAYIWLAAGSLNNLSEQKCAVLKGRRVVLYPDLGAFDAWQAKAKQLAHIASFTVFDVLEQVATDAHRAEGLDIADYLMGLWPL